MRHSLSLFVGVMFLSACTEAPQSEPAVGMANPASVYCEKLGGWVEIRDEGNGQTGYCHLPDGKVVDEWDLFRAQHADLTSPPEDVLNAK